MASRRAASRIERARLQCRAPLDDGVIEQFEHQTKGRQFLFLDGAVIVAFERSLMMASTSRCIASSLWLDSAVRTLETRARILLRWPVFSSLSSRFK